MIRSSCYSRNFKIVAMVILTIFLQACAFGAEPEGMLVSTSEARSLSKNQKLKDLVAVAKVSGGSATLPFWASNINDDGFEEAIEVSLLNAGYGVQHTRAKYFLIVEIIDVDKDYFGLDLDVVTTIKYTLVDKVAHRSIFSAKIKETGTATMNDSVWGSKRLRIANERSAKKNITKFLKKLNGINPKDVSLSFLHVELGV